MISYEDAQFMFEQFHVDGWNVGKMEYPYGRGINFSIEVNDIETMYDKLISSGYPLYRPMMTSQYEVKGEILEQKEFLLQDPDGYLLRFIHE